MLVKVLAHACRLGQGELKNPRVPVVPGADLFIRPYTLPEPMPWLCPPDKRIVQDGDIPRLVTLDSDTSHTVTESEHDSDCPRESESSPEKPKEPESEP